MPLSEIEKELLENFGNNMREIRLAKKWSMEHLANQAEIELSQIYRIEKGKINPKFTTIVRLSKVLGINLTDFINKDKI